MKFAAQDPVLLRPELNDADLTPRDSGLDAGHTDSRKLRSFLECEKPILWVFHKRPFRV